jgi:anhydro-N-acetylmuramic acid kinase
MLRERLDCPVYVHEDFGISSDAKEAMAFALMAQATLEGVSSNVPLATGARKPTILGKIVLPGK